MTSRPAIDWSRAPLGPGVAVLALHPLGLVALNKPAGVLSHPNHPSDQPRSLLTASYDEHRQCFAWATSEGRPCAAWLLHRLDGATSGVVLMASDETVAAGAFDAFEQRRVRKHYLAVVLGHSREKRAVWIDAMQVRREKGVVRAARGGVRAETAMSCLKLIPGPPAMSVLELEPRTGRTHQLRHQCALRHLPILGDQTYGNFSLNRELARRLGTSRLFLHAASVELQFILGTHRVDFAARSPAPAEFADIAGGSLG